MYYIKNKIRPDTIKHLEIILRRKSFLTNVIVFPLVVIEKSRIINRTTNQLLKDARPRIAVILHVSTKMTNSGKIKQ